MCVTKFAPFKSPLFPLSLPYYSYKVGKFVHQDTYRRRIEETQEIDDPLQAKERPGIDPSSQSSKRTNVY